MTRTPLVGALITAARRVAEARTGLLPHGAGRGLCFRDGWPEDGVIALPLAPLRAVEEIAVFGEDDQKARDRPGALLVDAASRPARRDAARLAPVAAAGPARSTASALSVQAGFGPRRAACRSRCARPC